MNNKFWHKFYFNIPIIIWSKFFNLFINEVIKYSVNRVANHFWRNFIFVVVAVTAFAVFAIFAVVFAVVAVAVLITESIVINNSKLH